MAYFGIPLLDNDIPFIKGTLILIKEDETSYNHMLFIKIFCSANGFNVYGNEELEIPNKILIKTNTKPIPINKIAWKYKSNKEEHEGYDMVNTRKIKCLKYIPLKDIKDDCIIVSLFSPIFFECINENPIKIFKGIKTDHEFNEATTKNKIYENLFDLRKFVKENNKTVLVSVPYFLYEKCINWNLYADLVFRLENYEYYNGLLIVEKGGCNRYGFKVNSKGVLLEEVIIPPEGLEEKEVLHDF